MSCNIRDFVTKLLYPARLTIAELFLLVPTQNIGPRSETKWGEKALKHSNALCWNQLPSGTTAFFFILINQNGTFCNIFSYFISVKLMKQSLGMIMFCVKKKCNKDQPIWYSRLQSVFAYQCFLNSSSFGSLMIEWHIGGAIYHF